MQAKIYLALAGTSCHSINSARADRGSASASGREDFSWLLLLRAGGTRTFRGFSPLFFFPVQGLFYGLYRDAVWSCNILWNCIIRSVISQGTGICSVICTVAVAIFYKDCNPDARVTGSIPDEWLFFFHFVMQVLEFDSTVQLVLSKTSRNCSWYLHRYCTDVGSWYIS